MQLRVGLWRRRPWFNHSPVRLWLNSGQSGSARGFSRRTSVAPVRIAPYKFQIRNVRVTTHNVILTLVQMSVVLCELFSAVLTRSRQSSIYWTRLVQAKLFIAFKNDFNILLPYNLCLTSCIPFRFSYDNFVCTSHFYYSLYFHIIFVVLPYNIHYTSI